jgi:hypothetical protein
MSDVVEFKRSTPPPAKPEPIFEDEWLLKLCAEWRVCRATMEINWARHNSATVWGHGADCRASARRWRSETCRLRYCGERGPMGHASDARPPASG